MYRRRMRKSGTKFLSRYAARRSNAKSCQPRFTSDLKKRKPIQIRKTQARMRQMAYPKDYRYTKEHEWIQVKGNTGLVGITDHAQESLGDIVFVELPKVGAQIDAGKSFGTVESVKAVSE